MGACKNRLTNKHPKSMFVEENKRNSVYPYRPHFSLYKVRLKRGANCMDLLTYWSDSGIYTAGNIMLAFHASRNVIFSADNLRYFPYFCS